MTLLPRTTAFGYYDGNLVGAIERVADHLAEPPAHAPRQRLWKIRARAVVLASGAIERAIAYADNDLPGTMLAGAARTLRRSATPCARARAPSCSPTTTAAYAAALALHEAGVAIAAIVDARTDARHSTGALPSARARPACRCVRVPRSSPRMGRSAFAAVDVVALGGGATSTPRLRPRLRVRRLQSRGPPVFAGARHAALRRSARDVRSRRVAVADRCRRAPPMAASILPPPWPTATPRARRRRRAQGSRHVRIERTAARRASRHAPLHAAVGGTCVAARARSASSICRTTSPSHDIALAAREGYQAIEHLKRYTTLGMGTDQGKTSNIVGLALLAEQLGVPIATRRHDDVPAALHAGHAGGDSRARAWRATSSRRATRRCTTGTSAHGARFVNAGLWKRPHSYPRDGESEDDAVNREARNVRSNVGIVDVSTLGKIELQGRDVVELLNRVYINKWDTLAVGRCRYGVMLREDGMVMDDGTTSRLSATHYLMTTTTVNAVKVMQQIEYLLQAEWPELEVYATSVTEQWAAAAVSGPKARDVVAGIVDIDVSNEAFPFLAVGECRVRAGAERDSGAAVPDELFRRARVRDPRAGRSRSRDVGSGDRRGRAVRHHAVRHRGDEHAADRKGPCRHRTRGRRPHDGRRSWHGQARQRRESGASASRCSSAPH